MLRVNCGRLRKLALIEGPNTKSGMLTARVLDFQATAAERRTELDVARAPVDLLRVPPVVRSAEEAKVVERRPPAEPRRRHVIDLELEPAPAAAPVGAARGRAERAPVQVTQVDP